VFGAGTAPEPVDLAPLLANIGQVTLANEFFRKYAHQGGVAERKAIVDRELPLSVGRQAKLLEISRGAVFHRPRQTSETDLALMRRFDELHLEHPFMGARMLRRMLMREGIRVGRRHLGTLMQRMGIAALCPQPGTSERNSQHQPYPYLLRKVAIRRATQFWALDTTYIHWPEGSCILPPPSMWPPAGCWPTR
jgi:putative transposase